MSATLPNVSTMHLPSLANEQREPTPETEEGASPTRLSPMPGLRPAHQANSGDAAQKFEAFLLQQMLQILRKTLPNNGMMGGGEGTPGADMYMNLVDEAVAGHLAQSGGIGISSMLERAMGGEPSGQLTGTVHSTRPAMMQAQLAATPLFPQASSGTPLSGATGVLQQQAAPMVDTRSADRWGRDGALLPQDLQSGIATETAGGVARFNVRDANGYQGYYKCNLFAFELARRAGFQVPVVGRVRGWGYPVPDDVTADASDGQMRGGWARVATGTSASTLDNAIRGGQRAFLLTGSAEGDRAGHMAVVERVHDIDYDANGGIRRIVFDGWEGRENGAEHLSRRTWNLYGNPGGTSARNGFERIEVLELQHAGAPGREEVPLSRVVGPSLRDSHPGENSEGTSESASSSEAHRPNGGSEELR